MKALLIGSGQYVPFDILEKEIDNSDIIIAVDGGFNHLHKIKKIPDVFIGDQDSVNQDILLKLNLNNIEIIKFNKEKDMTDMDLAIDYIYNKKISEVVIFGGTGTRLDHTLANLFLLNKLDELNIFGKIIDINNEVVLVKDNYIVKKDKYNYLSIIPISYDGIKINLRGFKYPLDNYHIKFNSTIGISNEILNDIGKVEILSGKALLFTSVD